MNLHTTLLCFVTCGFLRDFILLVNRILLISNLIGLFHLFLMMVLYNNIYCGYLIGFIETA